MKGLYIKRGGAFYPFDDETYDKFRKIKEGKAVELQFTQKRNIEFHRKYFALLNTAWAYLSEEQEKVYGSIEGFRKTLQIAAGYYEPVLDFQEGRFVKSPASIAFDKMSEEEFAELYEKAKDVLFTYVLTNVTLEEFLSNLNEF
ncbi:MAG: DUF1367 family protein [Prevotella sp.]|nr:DUF1367 family protein [Candidatus Prevotella equi]